ncbi:MAG: glycosyltransferase [Lachnospiraceae bacterium]|nr:glycosyltransferase [Lachnospiraceae bacterium]
MRIIHILSSNKFSGAERVAIQIIQYLGRQGVDAWYISVRGKIEERLKKEKISYYLAEKMNLDNIKKIVKKLKPDIIHAHDYRASIICAFSTNIPVLSHLHNNSPWIKKYGLYSWIYAASSVRYKKILLVSNAILKEYVFSKQITNKCRVIGNPVRIGEIVKKGKENVVEEEYDIIFVGRLTPSKNPILLLEVMYEIKKYDPGIRLCIVGTGELLEKSKETCRKLGLEKNVVWKGFVENPFPYMVRAKIFLLPSSWEGFGLAAVEALALGKPVVCRNVGGLNNIVNERCGFLCEGKEELVEACRKLLGDRELYKRMAEMALSRAEEMDNDRSYMEGLWEIYQEICMEH